MRGFQLEKRNPAPVFKGSRPLGYSLPWGARQHPFDLFCLFFEKVFMFIRTPAAAPGKSFTASFTPKQSGIGAGLGRSQVASPDRFRFAAKTKTESISIDSR